MTFNKGDIVLFSHGAYSDYQTDCLARVLIPFNRKPMVALWAQETGREIEGEGRSALVRYIMVYSSNYEGDTGIGFIAWLQKKGVVEEINYKDFHQGEYGSFYLYG